MVVMVGGGSCGKLWRQKRSPTTLRVKDGHDLFRPLGESSPHRPVTCSSTKLILSWIPLRTARNFSLALPQSSTPASAHMSSCTPFTHSLSCVPIPLGRAVSQPIGSSAKVRNSALRKPAGSPQGSKAHRYSWCQPCNLTFSAPRLCWLSMSDLRKTCTSSHSSKYPLVATFGLHRYSL